MKTHDYKLLLLDLDGTTIPAGQYSLPSKKVHDAIQKAKKNISVSIATGRGYDYANLAVDNLELSGPGVFSAGAKIINMPSGEILSQQLLSETKIREILKITQPFGYDVYCDEFMYPDNIHDARDLISPTAKLLVADAQLSDARHIADELTGVLGVTAHVSVSWNNNELYCVDITHRLANKRHGAERLINMLGFRKEQVIAIGDGYNDVPLLEAAGLKIVMGNAPDELKPLADYVAPPINEDGVAVAIEKFILN